MKTNINTIPRTNIAPMSPAQVRRGQKINAAVGDFIALGMSKLDAHNAAVKSFPIAAPQDDAAIIAGLRSELAAARHANNELETQLNTAQFRAESKMAAKSPLSGLTGEALWTAEFNSSADLQEGYALGGLPSYIATKKREATAARSR